MPPFVRQNNTADLCLPDTESSGQNGLTDGLRGVQPTNLGNGVFRQLRVAILRTLYRGD